MKFSPVFRQILEHVDFGIQNAQMFFRRSVLISPHGFLAQMSLSPSNWIVAEKFSSSLSALCLSMMHV